MPKLHGFTLLRNGLKYDYPFRESLAGLHGLCDSVTVALGKSEDGTEAEIARLPWVNTVPTVWDEAKRQGGVILSEQTNIALEEVRKKQGSGWGFYLQADEAISERDYDLIRADVAKAEAEGYDCISFRYFHFWQSYERICVGRRWYPQEIRAIRLDSPIESYGDAQSFRDWQKRYESEAVIYHYGHVREAGAYASKKKDFHRWWHSDGEIAKVLARGERNDSVEPTLAYYGPHPAVMKERIEAQGGLAKLARPKLTVLGSPLRTLPEPQAELDWTQSESLILEKNPESTVLLRPLSWWNRLRSFGRYFSAVPTRMGSPDAREWTPETQAILKFSERGARIP